MSRFSPSLARTIVSRCTDLFDWPNNSFAAVPPYTALKTAHIYGGARRYRNFLFILPSQSGPYTRLQNRL
jgi:hypothetical protein